MYKADKNQIKQILGSLSLDEKIRLLNGEGSWNSFSAGGKIPVVSMSDGPHGLRRQTGEESYADINRSNIATCFPTASCVASSWNIDSTRKMAKAIALEAKYENVQIMLGCGMNIKRSSLCGRNFEYFTEDPLLNGELAASYVDGMQSEGIGACIKHFACNNQEKYRQTSSSNIDLRTLREIYLSGFERVVRKSHPISIMSSYNMVNGKYASASKLLLTDFLRNEWGFDGIVISDWGGNIGAAESLKAGLDIGMPDSFGYFSKQLKEALKDGTITEADIDETCSRIIDVVLRLKANPANFENESLKKEPLDYKKQHEVALELVLDSAVLLKNDGILPIGVKPDEKKSIVVIGELAEYLRFQGGGSSHITTSEYPNAVEELSKDYNVEYSAGYYSRFCKKSKKARIDENFAKKAVELVCKAVEKEKNVPVLFFCGLPDAYEGEGFDRENLKLPKEQTDLYEKLLKITKNIILVTFSGSPMDLSFAKEARAILHMYLCGQACAKAVAEFISGRSNPCGKLAETWPLSVQDEPCFQNFGGENFSINYAEGVLVGYRWYETKKIPVQYEFGYGLSYTCFEYSSMSVENIEKHASSDPYDTLFKVKMCVKNTGFVDGSEIVQVYTRFLGDNAENISRSSIELAGFKKVFLKAGESKNVEFLLERRAFCVYSTKKNCFSVVGGAYQICIASSVKDIKLAENVDVVGDDIKSLVHANEELYSKVFSDNVFHKKGEFTLRDNLLSMSKQSLYVRIFLKFVETLVVLTSPSKTGEDPAVRITISAIRENPLESLISTGSEIFNEKLVRKLLRKANGR
ncbi:MAG: glycoside hydrolase family 3 N-terminal domain-containing protein [Treponemataceae bacterium]